MQEVPASTITLFVVVGGALFAHSFGAFIFYMQGVFCSTISCIALGFDPNPYKAYFTSKPARLLSHDLGIFLAVFYPFTLGVLVAYITQWTAQKEAIRNRLKPEATGWTRELAEAASDDLRAVTCYVLTKLQHEGRYVAYEGVVHQLSVSSRGVVEMVTLAEADRFLVEVGAQSVKRQTTENDPIQLIQIAAPEIANFAMNVTDLPPG